MRTSNIFQSYCTYIYIDIVCTLILILVITWFSSLISKVARLFLSKKGQQIRSLPVIKPDSKPHPRLISSTHQKTQSKPTGIYTHIYIHIYIYTYTYLYISIHIYTYTYTFTYTYTYTYVRTYIHFMIFPSAFLALWWPKVRRPLRGLLGGGHLSLLYGRLWQRAPWSTVNSHFTLWLCQNSYWTWTFIVDFPIKHGDFP